MQIKFEMSPEEREEIIEKFLELVNQNPIESKDDLIRIIATIISNILDSADESIMQMCAECVKETLETSPVYQALVKQYANQTFLEDTTQKMISVAIDSNEILDENQKILEIWNQTIARKEYVIMEQKYKS